MFPPIMNPKRNPTHPRRRFLPGGLTGRLNSAPGRSRGFALVVTLSLMILLTIIAVGLLSLSAIALRSSTQGMAMAEARANARLGLMMAVAELQKEFGPDQRISASAGILGSPTSSDSDVANSHWIGSWDSWKGENRYLVDDHTEDDLVPDLSDHREDSFRRWLVSAEDPDDLAELNRAKTALGEDSIVLVGSGTLGQNADDGGEVRAARVILPGKDNGSRRSQGAYAWWVGDESQKGDIRAGRSDDELKSHSDAIAEADSSSSVAEDLYEQFQGPVEEEKLGRATVSLNTLGLVDEASDLGSGFHDLTVDARSVLADVREGGLKKDLNLLAEYYSADIGAGRSALPLSEEFMLYDFGELNRVPLHDLLNYYTFYKVRPAGTRRGALNADGRSKPSTSNISTREWSSERNGLMTNLYRQPVLVKTQLAIWARAERSGTNRRRPYRLKFRFSPIITMWNPYNTPLVLNENSGDGLKVQILGISADMAVWPTYSRGRDSGRESSSLGGLTTGSGDESNSSEVLANMIIRDQVEFAPGEVRVFSLDQTYGDLASERELKPGYWPNSGNEMDYFDIVRSRGGNPLNWSEDSDSVTFTPSQIIGVGFAGGTEDASKTKLKFFQGVSVEVRPDYSGNETSWRTQALYSRRTPQKNPSAQAGAEMNRFNQLVFELGSQLSGEEMRFRTGEGKYIRNPYSIRNLASTDGEMIGVFSYGVAAENEVLAFGAGSQPRFPCRPFLHSLPTAGSPWIQDVSTAALYNLGWAWKFSDGRESSNEIVVDGAQGRFGGGWSAAYGQARVVQYELPQRPFHSLAQFSNAALGGWSVARNHPTDTSMGLLAHETTTAHGQGGLFPAVSMPIGNSYANPLIPRDRAVTTWNMRKYHGAERSEPFVDHSYLANHALWDEYFMSSVADQSRGLHLYSDFRKDKVLRVAQRFFGEDREPLPNERFVPATDEPWNEFKSELFAGARVADTAYQAIARYLLLEGGFNVNSTSEDAWAALFASLRGKPLVLLPGESTAASFDLEEHPDETPIANFSVGTGESIEASSNLRSDGFAPEQWVGSFTLTDNQVRKLAEEVVKQVKKRGPFLSLSDFINRQLSNDVELAKSGALQAAIEEAGLNEAIQSNRSTDLGQSSEFLSSKGKSDPDPIPFPEAGQGPVIQGSAAYIDQADLLRGIDSQLVPRGDTFVIRTCGESLDGAGKVIARAYCEAVVQRLPEYLDARDLPETRADELTAEINQRFGRKFEIVSFRWLSPLEI